MAKDLEKEIEVSDKKSEKLAAKKKKAEEKKAELTEKIEELRNQIADETDEKAKTKLRKQRDEIIALRDGITKSKDGMTVPMAPRTKKIIKSAVAVVVVIALLCTYVATGAVRHGLTSFFGLPQSTFTAFTVSDGDGNKHAIKVSTYNYYFAVQYNSIRSNQQTYTQYGIDLGDAHLDVDFDEKFSKQTTKNDDGKTVTWAEYMHDEVVESIKSTYTYYYEAVKANGGKEPKITEDQQKELDDTLKEYTETAKGYGFTLDGYLKVAMGKGVNEDVFVRETKISYIAQNYKTDYNEDLLKKEYTEKDYNKYKNEHEDELLSVSIKIFDCDSEDDAKAFAKALKPDGSNFAELASKYSESDFDKELNKDTNQTIFNDITKSTLQSAGNAIAASEDHDEETAEEGHEHEYPGLDWLFSTKRKAGDIKQYSTSVVYVLRPVKLSDTKTVNARHILVSPYFNVEEDSEEDTSDATKATDEQWKAAYKQTKKILKEWKEGEATAESFGKLAAEHTEDSNGDDGGLYENITPNQMVPTFGNWCFDSARKAGDTAVVKTKFGYHIIYFESEGEFKAWEYTAQQALASDDAESDTNTLEKSYKIKENWFGSRYFEKDTDIDS